MNLIIRCGLAIIAIIPLLRVHLGGGPVGAGFATLKQSKMEREIFSSLIAPIFYYLMFAMNGIVVFVSTDSAFRILALVNLFIVWAFLYRLGPNIMAWASIMSVVRMTPRGRNQMRLIEQNVEAELKRQASEFTSAYMVHDHQDHLEGISIPQFNHSEWLARQLGFWTGERKSLFEPFVEEKK
jgi:hypothetical protein